MQHIRQKVVLNLSLARRWCLWCNQWIPMNAVNGTWELCAKFALVTKEKQAIVPSTVAAFPWMFIESYCTWLGKSKHQSTCNYGHVFNSTVSTKKKKDILSWAGPSKVFSEAYFHVPHYWTLRHCQCHSLWSYIILCLQGLSKFWNPLPCYCLPLHYLLTD